MSPISCLVMAAISWAAGFYLFNWANNIEIQYKKDMESISAGDFTEHEYTVGRKYIQKSHDSQNSHMMLFEGPNSFYRDVGSEQYYKISVGDTFLAKHLNGKVWIDELDSEPCTGRGKWFLLGLGGLIGLVPMAMGSYDFLKNAD